MKTPPVLLDILSTRRPYNTQGEVDFIKKYLHPWCTFDECGNAYYRIGDAPIMWSCHTDTVTAKDGFQKVKRNLHYLELDEGKAGQSLGADDGAGMWLLLQMIDAEIPGLYIFHRGEERGGIGSSWIVKNNPDLVKGIKYAVAFDRRGVDSVITHQAGGRCCSQAFAEAFAAQLGGKYEPDPTGSFTDTANYTDLIPECTNVSVGYYDEHGPRECLDLDHLLVLRDRMLEIDVTKLPCERDPTELDYDYYWPTYHPKAKKVDDPLDDLARIVEEFPYDVAGLLEDFGFTADSLWDHIMGKEYA